LKQILNPKFRGSFVSDYRETKEEFPREGKIKEIQWKIPKKVLFVSMK
jgi:hypothetical protein